MTRPVCMLPLSSPASLDIYTIWFWVSSKESFTGGVINKLIINKLRKLLFSFLILAIIASVVGYVKAATTEQILDWERLIPSLVIGLTLLFSGVCLYVSIW